MPATNETTNYELPLFVDDDQPTWLGDFNGAMNKIDDDLWQVAANTTKALDTSAQALSLAKTNEQDIAIVDDQLAGTRDSGLKTIIEQETTRAKGAEDSLRKSITRENSLMHFGAIDIEKDAPNTKYPQAMCIRDDVLVCVTANITDSNACTVFDISRETGEVLKTTNVNWGHANSIAYDKAENCLYVCPNIDYTANKAYVNHMYKVDPLTYATLDTITFTFEPHSISVDNVTGECYLTGESVNPFVITLYSLDKTTWTPTKIGVIDTNLTEPDFIRLDRYGTQNIRSYNGELWYLVGGPGVNALLNLDKTTAKTKHVISNLNMSYIYPLTEAECFDFTEHGDIYLWSRCGWFTGNTTKQYSFGVLSMLNMYGGRCCNYPNSVYAQNSSYVKPSYSNVTRYGTKENPFSSVIEAIMSQQYGYSQAAIISENCELSTGIDLHALPLFLYITGGCTLTIGANLFCGCLTIRSIGSGVATINVSKDVYIGNYVELCRLTVTGSTINVTRGILNSIIVTGGTFDGDGHTGLFKTAASTGTYSRFIQSSAS